MAQKYWDVWEEAFLQKLWQSTLEKRSKGEGIHAAKKRDADVLSISLSSS